MKKKLVLILASVIIIVVSIIAILKYRESTIIPDINILDGPGSYVDIMTGTVEEVTDVTDSSYQVLLKLDEEFAGDGNREYVKAVIEYGYEDEVREPFEVGSHIMIRFAGGVDFDGDPMFIDYTYGADLVDENGDIIENDGEADNMEDASETEE